jgi:hypothetical protein
MGMLLPQAQKERVCVCSLGRSTVYPQLDGQIAVYRSRRNHILLRMGLKKRERNRQEEDASTTWRDGSPRRLRRRL